MIFLVSLISSLLSCSDGDEATPMTADKFELPVGTRIYVSDVPNFGQPPWKIIQYDHRGENPEVFIDEELDWPQDILFLEDKNEVLVSNLNSGRINRYNSTTGAYIDAFATGIGGPTRMKIGPDDLLYVLQWSGSGKVRRYELDGTFVDDFTETGLPQSIGLDWDAAGNLYVSSFQNNQVTRFDSEGKDQGLFINSQTTGPTNIWFDDSGNLLVNDWRAGEIYKFNNTGEFIETFASGLSQVEGVSTLSDGSVLIGNGGTGAVKLYGADGTFIEDFVAARLGDLRKPNAVILRSSN